MRIAVVLALCFAFLSSTAIYGIDTEQSVNFTGTPSETALSSITGNAVSTENESDSVETPVIVTNNSSELEKVNNDSEKTLNESQYNSTISSNNNTTKEEIKAAGTTSSKNSVTISIASIKSAAITVKAYIEKNKKLPSYVTIANQKFSMSQFLYLLAKGTRNLNSGITSSIILKSVSGPSSPSGSSKVGNIKKSAYITIAGNVATYIEKYGKAPNYARSSLGNIQYQKLIYTLSKIIAFHQTNKRLPQYVSVTSISIKMNSSSADTSSVVNKINDAYAGEILANYLKATTNCQVNDANIKALAASITKGSTSTLDKATKIFNWVRDNLKYDFYYNTKYGATKTLQIKKANCVDHTHLLVALSRAAGLSARYVHGTCKFNSGSTYGHVWAQIYVNGVWYAGDATSYNNKLGTINNWNVSSAVIKGKYVTLPF
ncbi:transglutaminase domain-containing protein [Methanobacterium alcaliphilum]|uniref:transglutaminase domain-containing protein n=1 Tax=Methanobacterium alcaliphilum TaxID=392018 RepID=UPI00200A2736|nr:transglutaminase domain-containing protein [Methanobacterium alcaliphilum]MCK9150755.1 transglutaminase domain-containing protein [Methanobacterium alcaliphilum]